MTAPEKLMQLLVHAVTGVKHEEPDTIRAEFVSLSDDHELSDALSDTMEEMRSGDEETGLPCGHSRYYSSRAVAAEMLDGSLVGWTFWFGGGKHGEPQGMPWVEVAYDVTVTEVQKVVREFARKEESK